VARIIEVKEEELNETDGEEIESDVAGALAAVGR